MASRSSAARCGTIGSSGHTADLEFRFLEPRGMRKPCTTTHTHTPSVTLRKNICVALAVTRAQPLDCTRKILKSCGECARLSVE